ncbi:MAG: metallophosphoesterase [Clostridiales bacterium]|nr:metallophosphoesterase [Clostridiales bacterium]
MKKSLLKGLLKGLFAAVVLSAVAFAPQAGAGGGAKIKTLADAPVGIAAHWDFQNDDASRSGTIAGMDLKILDKSGNGNDLEMRVYDNPGHMSETAVSNLSWSDKNMSGNGGSLEFSGGRNDKIVTNQQVERAFKKPADFITEADAPINDNQFLDGYTLEFMYYLPEDFSVTDHSNTNIMNRYSAKSEVDYVPNKGAVESNRGSTNVVVTNCKELQYFTVNAAQTKGTQSLYGVSMDWGGKWYHIAVVCDNTAINVYVNGALGFRNYTTAPFDMQGLYASPDLGEFVFGSLTQSDTAPTRAPVFANLNKLMHGNLQSARIAERALDKSEWLVSDFSVHTASYGNNGGFALKNPDNYNFAVIPDTQNTVKFVSGRNETGDENPYGVLDKAAAYTAQNYRSMNLKAMLHIGDVVENHTAEWQYQNYAATLKTMTDAGIKIQLTRGNHDQGGGAGLYAKYFRNSTSDYAKAAKSYVHFEKDGSQLLNSYMKVSAGSYTYLFIQLDNFKNGTGSAQTGQGNENAQFNDDQKNWLKGVLEANPDLPTVIFCHNMFSVSGSEPSKINVDGYWIGEQIWNIVKDYNQVFMMVAGHNHGSGWITKENTAGNDVFMMLVDYQFGYNGGNAYYRFTEFDEANDKIYLSTFSPYAASLSQNEKTPYDLNYMTGAGNEGEWNIDFSERFSFVTKNLGAARQTLKRVKAVGSPSLDSLIAKAEAAFDDPECTQSSADFIASTLEFAVDSLGAADGLEAGFEERLGSVSDAANALKTEKDALTKRVSDLEAEKNALTKRVSGLEKADSGKGGALTAVILSSVALASCAAAATVLAVRSRRKSKL